MNLCMVFTIRKQVLYSAWLTLKEITRLFGFRVLGLVANSCSSFGLDCAVLSSVWTDVCLNDAVKIKLFYWNEGFSDKVCIADGQKQATNTVLHASVLAHLPVFRLRVIISGLILISSCLNLQVQ